MRRSLLIASSLSVLIGIPFLAGAASAGDELPSVTPVSQTRAFGDDASADPPDADADDPAIWVHPTQKQESVVIGTLKDAGLAGFDLQGEMLQHIAAPPAPTPDAAPGRFNNVAVLGSYALVSDRGRDRVRVYEIDKRGATAGDELLRDVTSPETPRVFAKSEPEVDEQHTAYGLAAGTDRATGQPLVVVSQRSETRLARLALVEDATGVAVKRQATVALPSNFTLPDGTQWGPCTEPGDRPQVEGMVVDSEHGILYAAQEAVGIWRIPLVRNGFGSPVPIDKVRSYGVPAHYDEATDECITDGPDPGYGGRWLTADAEGLTIAPEGSGGQLIASSQGDSTFVIYDREGRNQHLGGFVVGAGNGHDSVESSDGADVVTTPLGSAHPQGLLVVHDGERQPPLTDPDGEPIDSTGFAYLSWADVLHANS